MKESKNINETETVKSEKRKTINLMSNGQSKREKWTAKGTANEPHWKRLLETWKADDEKEKKTTEGSKGDERLQKRCKQERKKKF